MAGDSPAVVIVTGSWHVHEHYQKPVDRLRTAGYPAYCERLPSNSNEIPARKTLKDDTDTIHEQVERLADAGHAIIVVMHSYGGVVGTNALKDLSFDHRSSTGAPGGVVHLIYMCAFVVALGNSLADTFGGSVAPWIELRPDGAYEATDRRAIFFNDLPDDEAQYWAERNTLQATRCTLTDKISYAAYEDIPMSYLLCEEDQAVPVGVQRMMAEACGQVVRYSTCRASHSPFLSMPGVVVQSIEDAWSQWKMARKS